MARAQFPIPDPSRRHKPDDGRFAGEMERQLKRAAERQRAARRIVHGLREQCQDKVGAAHLGRSCGDGSDLRTGGARGRGDRVGGRQRAERHGRDQQIAGRRRRRPELADEMRVDAEMP